MIAINQLIYVVIRPNSEAPYVRPTVSTPATPVRTPATMGPCLIPARKVLTHTPAGRQRAPHFRTSYDSSTLGLGYSRFMTHESGSMFGFCAGLAIHSLLQAIVSALPRRVATMTAYDSIERGAADECEPLTRTTTTDVYAHATARRVRCRVRLRDRGDDVRERPRV